jgi:hypothetical protein
LVRIRSFHASDKADKKPTQFRQRYDELEAKRLDLLERLAKIGEVGRKHSGFGTASTLLNQRFRKAKLVQRGAILQAATWMIEVLERLVPML